MPIILPTLDEYERLDYRQRDALYRRLDAKHLHDLVDRITKSRINVPAEEDEFDVPLKVKAAKPAPPRKSPRPITETVAKFNETWDEHQGLIVDAAVVLGIKATTLQRALSEAQRRGLHLKPVSHVGRHNY